MNYITDDFMNTCEVIDIGVDRTLPSLTTFRVTHTAVAGSQVDVGLTGKNLKCDRGFYVTRITPADVDKLVRPMDDLSFAREVDNWRR